MTDEEMAEEYAHNHVHYEVAKRENGTEYAKEVSSVTIKQAYSDGLKDGRPKWHKVTDGDLPKETEFIESDVLLLLVQLKGTKHKRYELGTYSFPGEVFIYPHLKRVEDVVAWCEIPKFEEVR